MISASVRPTRESCTLSRLEVTSILDLCGLWSGALCDALGGSSVVVSAAYVPPAACALKTNHVTKQTLSKNSVWRRCVSQADCSTYKGEHFPLGRALARILTVEGETGVGFWELLQELVVVGACATLIDDKLSVRVAGEQGQLQSATIVMHQVRSSTSRFEFTHLGL